MHQRLRIAIKGGLEIKVYPTCSIPSELQPVQFIGICRPYSGEVLYSR